VSAGAAYVCTSCGARHAIAAARWRCDCGAPLDLEFEAGAIDARALALRPHGLSRYGEALPIVPSLGRASLGPGLTPLIDDGLGATPVHLSLEYVSPTGSYKDRGAALLVALASSLGASSVLDDSSGNAGIALAAAAARAGLAARILVPDDASEAKPRIAEALGAEVVRVPGGRAAAAAAAEREASAGAFYASHTFNPFFLHGTKTLAYSLAESLRWVAPGAVVVPAGNGGLVLGLDLGFRELRRHGILDRRPSLVAVQARGCAPIFRAYEKGEASPSPVPEEPTIADGIRIGAPPRGAAVLKAIRESGGTVLAVDDREIEAAKRTLWTKGYAVETTGAVAAAAVLREGASLRKSFGDLVVVLTGSGLKA
jgi:threonine synthase